MKIPVVPYHVDQWRREHPGEEIPTGTSSPSPGLPGRRQSAGTTSSTTSTRPTGHAAPSGRFTETLLLAELRPSIGTVGLG
jgi:hypothetical protein